MLKEVRRAWNEEIGPRVTIGRGTGSSLRSSCLVATIVITTDHPPPQYGLGWKDFSVPSPGEGPCVRWGSSCGTDPPLALRPFLVYPNSPVWPAFFKWSKKLISLPNFGLWKEVCRGRTLPPLPDNLACLRMDHMGKGWQQSDLRLGQVPWSKEWYAAWCRNSRGSTSPTSSSSGSWSRGYFSSISLVSVEHRTFILSPFRA